MRSTRVPVFFHLWRRLLIFYHEEAICLCRRNLVPAVFLFGLGAGLLLSCLVWGWLTVLLAVAAILGGICLIHDH